jgi:hypothetical protein
MSAAGDVARAGFGGDVTAVLVADDGAVGAGSKPEDVTLVSGVWQPEPG